MQLADACSLNCYPDLCSIVLWRTSLGQGPLADALETNLLLTQSVHRKCMGSCFIRVQICSSYFWSTYCKGSNNTTF